MKGIFFEVYFIVGLLLMDEILESSSGGNWYAGAEGFTLILCNLS